MQWWAERARPAAIGRQSPRCAWMLRRVVAPIVRLLHRPTLEGIENLPAHGPYLLVANHSGGMGGSEIFSLAACWLRAFGDRRPVAGFAHPFGFSVWPISAIMRALGAIPSTYEHARAALAEGVPILVFPGGAHEITRPIWQANRVQLGGRRGYLRIARSAGVPVVPLGIRGSHYPVPTLWRSRLVLPNLLVVPRLLGIRWWPLTLLGLAGALLLLLPPGLGLGWPVRVLLAWAWLASPVPLFPYVPSRIRMRIGAPLAPADLFPGAGDDPERELARAARTVEAAVQALVDGRAPPAPGAAAAAESSAPACQGRAPRARRED